MTELWRNIDDYDGLYQVSNKGRIRRTKREILYNNGVKATHKEKVLNPMKVHNGYLRVCLSKNNCQKSYPVHVLVAKSFIPNPEKKPQVNHINENKEDNRLENLEWATCRENINHGTAINRRAAKRGVKVLQKTKQGLLVKEWNSMSEAGRNGFDFRNISACCRGIEPTHKGYKWEYA